MKTYLRNIVVCSLTLCAAACYSYDENDYSIPLPETFEGKVIDEGGAALSEVTLVAFIKTRYQGVGPEGTVRDKIARYARIKTNSNGEYLFDFRAESKKIADEHPAEAPVLSRYFRIHIDDEEYVRVKFVGDTTFVVRKSHLRPNDLEN